MFIVFHNRGIDYFKVFCVVAIIIALTSHLWVSYERHKLNVQYKELQTEMSRQLIETNKMLVKLKGAM